MSLSARENELIGRYQIIADRHERLNAIISRKLTERTLPLEERRDQWLVRGCASPVWLKTAVANGILEVHFAADSIMVRGLVALLVELYQGAEAAEVENFSPTLLETLGLDQMLSPTRWQGLEQVILTIRRSVHVD